MAELPLGTVTFLFRDLEGSTRLWEECPEAMRDALASHDAIVRDAIGRVAPWLADRDPEAAAVHPRNDDERRRHRRLRQRRDHPQPRRRTT
jgi:hypothetical protein